MKNTFVLKICFLNVFFLSAYSLNAQQLYTPPEPPASLEIEDTGSNEEEEVADLLGSTFEPPRNTALVPEVEVPFADPLSPDVLPPSVNPNASRSPASNEPGTFTRKSREANSSPLSGHSLPGYSNIEELINTIKTSQLYAQNLRRSWSEDSVQVALLNSNSSAKQNLQSMYARQIDKLTPAINQSIEQLENIGSVIDSIERSDDGLFACLDRSRNYEVFYKSFISLQGDLNIIDSNLNRLRGDISGTSIKGTSGDEESNVARLQAYFSGGRFKRDLRSCCSSKNSSSEYCNASKQKEVEDAFNGLQFVEIKSMPLNYFGGEYGMTPDQILHFAGDKRYAQRFKESNSHNEENAIWREAAVACRSHAREAIQNTASKIENEGLIVNTVKAIQCSLFPSLATYYGSEIVRNIAIGSTKAPIPLKFGRHTRLSQCSQQEQQVWQESLTQDRSELEGLVSHITKPLWLENVSYSRTVASPVTSTTDAEGNLSFSFYDPNGVLSDRVLLPGANYAASLLDTGVSVVGTQQSTTGTTVSSRSDRTVSRGLASESTETRRSRGTSARTSRSLGRSSNVGRALARSRTTTQEIRSLSYNISRGRSSVKNARSLASGVKETKRVLALNQQKSRSLSSSQRRARRAVTSANIGRALTRTQQTRFALEAAKDYRSLGSRTTRTTTGSSSIDINSDDVSQVGQLSSTQEEEKNQLIAANEAKRLSLQNKLKGMQTGLETLRGKLNTLIEEKNLLIKDRLNRFNPARLVNRLFKNSRYNQKKKILQLGRETQEIDTRLISISAQEIALRSSIETEMISLRTELQYSNFEGIQNLFTNSTGASTLPYDLTPPAAVPVVLDNTGSFKLNTILEFFKTELFTSAWAKQEKNSFEYEEKWAQSWNKYQDNYDEYILRLESEHLKARQNLASIYQDKKESDLKHTKFIEIDYETTAEMLLYLESMNEEFGDLIELSNKNEASSIPSEVFSILRNARKNANDADELILLELQEQLKSAPRNFKENENAWWSFVPAVLLD